MPNFIALMRDIVETKYPDILLKYDTVNTQYLAVIETANGLSSAAASAIAAADAAAISQNQAAVSAANAAESETNALSYSQQAATNATNARNYSVSAQSNANAAAASATTATTKATEAAASSTAAAASATTATTKATEAAASSTAAAASATTATTKATEAAASSTAAAASAATATTKATEAAASATLASQKAAQIQNLTPTAQTLTAGSNATASYNPNTGVLTLGIPQGIKGDKGDAFHIDAYGLLAQRSNYDNMAFAFSFLAVDTSTLYFKVSGATADWSAGVSFGKGDTGATGAAGSQWREGGGVPSNALGADGDLYLDTATGNVYQRGAGVYTFILNLAIINDNTTVTNAVWSSSKVDQLLAGKSDIAHTHAFSDLTAHPTTLGGYGITDAVAASDLGVNIATLVGGVIPANQLPSFVDDVLEYANAAAFPATGETSKIYVALDANRIYRWSGSVYVEISSAAIADAAVKLQTARILALSGDAIGSASFDGTADATINMTLSNSGVTAGSYKSVTVDGKGRVTGGSNPDTLAGYGITDAVGTAQYTAADVMAKVQTLDGHNSGLDADMLDGHHASEFVLAGSGSLPSNSQIFTASGTFTVPAGVNKIGILACGGGGAGGGSSNNGYYGSGGGGSVGSLTVFSVTPGQVLTITIGAGGIGVAGGNGSNGGDTIISGTGISLTIKGGFGGIAATTSTAVITSGGRGIGLATDGFPCLGGSYAGAGGWGLFGLPGGATSYNTNAPSAINISSGGGGVRSTSLGQYSGGNGAPGEVIIYW